MFDPKIQAHMTLQEAVRKSLEELPQATKKVLAQMKLQEERTVPPTEHHIYPGHIICFSPDGKEVEVEVLLRGDITTPSKNRKTELRVFPRTLFDHLLPKTDTTERQYVLIEIVIAPGLYHCTVRDGRGEVDPMLFELDAEETKELEEVYRRLNEISSKTW